MTIVFVPSAAEGRAVDRTLTQRARAFDAIEAALRRMVPCNLRHVYVMRAAEHLRRMRGVPVPIDLALATSLRDEAEQLADEIRVALRAEPGIWRPSFVPFPEGARAASR